MLLLLFSQPFFLPLLLSPFHLPQVFSPTLSPHNLSSMLPAKSEGSSHHNGKEIIVDDPPMEAEKGEEAPYSESDCSGDEKRSRDLGSECLPLIDPWHDTHSHFPVGPGDYSPPPPSYFWLSLK